MDEKCEPEEYLIYMGYKFPELVFKQQRYCHGAGIRRP